MKSIISHLLFCLLTFAFCLQKAEAAAPNWVVNPAAFQYSMTGTLRVKMDGVFVNATTTKVAALVGGQIRGLVNAPTMVGPNAYFPITIYSNTQSGETLGFWVYVAVTDKIHPADEAATFNRAVSLGTPPSPFVMNTYAAIFLPIELAEFTVNKLENGQKAQLDWRTASETDNAGFEIERSSDGLAFEKIGFEKGQNRAATYRFLDEKPLEGRSFYRLRQVDLDGAASFSPVRSVDFLIEKRPRLAATTGGFWLFSESEMAIRLTVFNATGQLFLNKKTEGTAFFEIEKASSGPFFVVAEQANGQRTQAVFGQF